MTWNSKERFLAVLSGETADRPPISAWGHFVGREENAKDLAEATLEFQKKYEWDFVKINPRATIFGEAWGNVSDFNQYIGDVPKINQYIIHEPHELDSIQEITTETGAFGEQLEVTRRIKEGLGEETPILQTLFSPLAIVEYLCGHRTVASNRSAARHLSPLPDLIENHSELLHRALGNITNTLGAYIKNAIQAGADGFFYAVLGLARNGFLTEEEYEKFGKPYDLLILEAAQGSSLLMHTCGPESNPARFKDYPVHALHWADHAEGNPTLRESITWKNNKCLMGGVDEELFKEEDMTLVEKAAEKTIQSLKGVPFILAPGCGLPVGTKETALKRFRKVIDV